MTKNFKTISILSTLMFGLLIGVNNVSAATLATTLKGRILLQVEQNGEAWYVNPVNELRYYLGRPADAFNVMRELGLGISNSDFDSFNGYAPSRLSGRILLKVADNGRAYYVNPGDLRMYYLGRPTDAFNVMRELGLGITDKNLNLIDRATPVTQQDLNSIFELSRKEAGTKIYYSDKLGVGFTYLSPVANYTSKITESATKIYLDNQSIEVFTKDPKLTLAEAIKSKFLQGYNSSDCFIKTNETNEQRLSSYVSAEISFPPPNDPDAPFWQNSDKCPQYYSQTNAVQYFLMNKDVPGKFLFVRIGQDSAASDGTPPTAEGGFNWSHSIRILK